MLVKDCHWRSHLSIGLAYKLKSPALAPKYSFALFLQKNGSLGELGHRWFLAFLAEERTQKCDRENRDWWWCQIKSIYRLHLDLVVKQLCYISCLNACATNCATFRNQKLCCGTVFLHKNDETKNSSGLQFKA